MKMGGLQHSENESLTAIFEGMIAPCIDIWDTDSAPPQGTSALYVAISGNTAAAGGGINNLSGSTSMTSVTVTNNTGGGVVNTTGTVTSQNTIIAADQKASSEA